MKSIKSGIWLPVAVIFFVGCAKEPALNSNTETNNQTLFKWDNAWNSENPFSDDSAGFYLAEYIEYIHDRSTDFTDYIEWFYHIKDLMDTISNYGTPSAYLPPYVSDIMTDSIQDLNGAYIASFRDSAASTMNTPIGSFLMARLHDTLDIAATGATITNAIKAWEDTVLQYEEELGEWDYDLLLHMGDVARFANVYWSSINGDSEMPFNFAEFKILVPYFTDAEIATIRGADADGYDAGYRFARDHGAAHWKAKQIGDGVGALCSVATAWDIYWN